MDGIDKEEKKRLKKELEEKKRLEKYEHIKQKTKARTREHIRKKRREFAQMRDAECAGMTEEEKQEWMKKMRDQKEEKKQKLWDALATGQRIAIDIHYQDQMSTEQSSVIRQLGLCHRANKDAKEHVSIHVCGATPETNEAMRAFGADKWPMTFHEENVESVFPPSELVYFSPDAEEALDAIDPSKVYVIGGLVDRSIAKNQSLNRANSMGVRCVRLPLAEFYPECLHRVLNINTLVEIIIAFSETHDWRATFERCIPIRKVKVTDESGCNFDYHLIKSKEQLEGISEYRINRYEMKHALHIYCSNHSIPYEFKNEERTYEQHVEEFKEEPRPPFLRFESTVYVNGEAVGKGRGKSQRAAQGRASWFALVHLGEIQVWIVCEHTTEKTTIPSFTIL